MRGGAGIEEHRLRNGLRLLIGERRVDPVVAVMLFYGVGARNETEREAGVAHLLEHMMFKGTRRYGKGEVDRVTTLLGGQNNAFTGNDHTAYWFEFASDRWETALEIEADRMCGLLLDPDELEAERAVVLDELAGGEDDPWRVLGRLVEEALFPRHPYGRPVIGFEDTLRGLGPGEVRDFYERFYHPGNATLVVCGDVEPRRVLAAARRHFGKLQRGLDRDAADCARAPLVEPPGERRVETCWDDPAKRLIMAWPTTAVGTPADYALDIVTTVLTSGRTSRLQRRLVREEGLATSVSASNDTRVEGGAFWLFAECAQGVDPASLEAAIDEELARLATDLLPAAERRRALAVLHASEAHDSEAISDIAEELGEFAVDADWDMALDGGVRHRKVTAAQLRRVVRDLLAPHRRVVGWSRPLSERRKGRTWTS